MRLILLMRLVALRRLAIHENARAAPLLKWSDEACDWAEERLREANAIPVRLGFSPL